MSKRDLTLDLFRSFKIGNLRRSSKKEILIKERNSKKTDPELISEVLSNLISERDWENGLAEGTLFTTWSKIVGVEIAQHTTPISILDGVLTVQTSSTAWATQLSLVSDQLLETIQNDVTGILIESLRFIGPQGPTWKRGIRTIRGARGPRDTYG